MSRIRRRLVLTGAAAAAALAMVALSTAPAQATPPSETFSTPGAHDFVVPADVTSVTVDAYGAAGGSGSIAPTVPGGLGGRVTATIAVTPGETLRVVVGGVGGSYLGGGPGAGGGNGGGNGGGVGAGGGGGGTDVRQGGTSLADRVVVAGGGGAGGGKSGCESGTGGAGGGNAPTAGGSIGSAVGGAPGGASAGGAGGSQGPMSGAGASGTVGVGGVGGTSSMSYAAGGGGGGWYGGGGGGGGMTASAGGGGGSAHVDGAATDVTYENGVRVGDGQVVLTWVVVPPTTTTTVAPTTTTTTAPSPTTTTPEAVAPGATFGPTSGSGGTQQAVVAGTGVTVNSEGWFPGSTVTVTMHSEPIVLGQATVGTNGAFVSTFAVPSTAPAGAHTLELTGTAANGTPATVTLGLTVTAAAAASAPAARPAALSFAC